MKTAILAAAFVVLAGQSAPAHRLDEYLQGTLISVEKDRVRLEMTLMPGVAVLPIVMGRIDGDHDGILSEHEERAYADGVLRDLMLSIDGRRLAPRLSSLRYSSMDEMRDGGGEIVLEFSAGLPRRGGNRKLVLENHHQSAIAEYQVNCLVPSDPDIRIGRQIRNYTQSRYELDYVQVGNVSRVALAEWWSEGGRWVGLLAFLLAGRFALIGRSRWNWQRRPTL